MTDVYKAPHSFYGLRVYVVEDGPKTQLGEAVKAFLTPEQIADHNEWLARFFGKTNVIPDGEYIVVANEGFVSMNPRTYQYFRSITYNVDERARVEVPLQCGVCGWTGSAPRDSWCPNCSRSRL